MSIEKNKKNKMFIIIGKKYKNFEKFQLSLVILIY
jgi:hypothetical protein